MSVRAVAAVAVVLAVLAAVTGCGSGGPAAPPRLVIAAGGPGDVYGLLGEALAEAAREEWSVRVEVVSTAGSVTNLQRVAQGDADVGFASVEAASLARSGNDPFSRALPLAALARLYDDYLQVVTLAGDDIRSLADLAGRPVSVGAAGSGTDLAAIRVLHTAGVQPGSQVQVGARTSAEALVSGEVDAFFVAGGLPTPAVAELAGQVELRLLALADLAGDLQDQFGEHYLARSIPAETYPGVDAEVGTVSVPNVLVVREDLPYETAYLLTELLFAAQPELVAAHEQARRLDHRSALATFPIELHPGAQRYYQDHKPLLAPRA